MSLLGTPLLWLLGGLTVAVPVGAYVLWSRVRGPRSVRLLSRVGLILAAQLAALSLVAAAINDYGYFYSSWSELAAGLGQGLGNDSSAATSEHAGPNFALGTAYAPRSSLATGAGANSGPVTVASAGKLTVHPHSGGRSIREWATRGRLDSVQIRGGTSQLSSHAYVYLPPQYFQSRYAHTYFPAAEVFSGYPGNEKNLVFRMHYHDILRTQIEHHRAKPMVLVLIRPSVTFPRDTECTNVPAGPQAETFFGSDVPAQVVRSYRVLPTGWGAIGDSTGGYCATKLTMLNPDVFSGAVSLSGYYFALHDATTGDLWAGSRAVRNINDLHWRLRHLPTPPVSILVATSRAEFGPDGYREAQKFVHEVTAPMTVDVLSIRNGGHNLRTWISELPSALGWLSGKMPTPGPDPAPAPHTPTNGAAGGPGHR